MNRPIFLLLVALSLAAVSLAQPAQAQQAKWYKGLPYFFNGNSQTSQPGTVITATINNNTTGHLNITATPTSGSYGTGGTYSGSVGVYYVWGGGSITSAMLLTTTQSLEDTGAGDSTSSGNSSAGGVHGQFYDSTGWDSKASPTYTDYFFSGDTPQSVNQVVLLTGTVSAPYDGSGSSTIVTAGVTFGDPVVTQ